MTQNGHIGLAIKTIRETRGWSQRKLAHKAECGSPYISLVESGQRTPSIENLHVIAKALEMPLYVVVLLGADKSGDSLPTKDKKILNDWLLHYVNMHSLEKVQHILGENNE